MLRRVLLDTSYIIALDHTGDAHHLRATQWAAKLAASPISAVLHTGILLEIADGFAKRHDRQSGVQYLEILTEEEKYELFKVEGSILERAVELYKRRPDKDWSLTDCISFILMGDLGIREALTADVHFQQAGFDCLLLRDPD